MTVTEPCPQSSISEILPKFTQLLDRLYPAFPPCSGSRIDHPQAALPELFPETVGVGPVLGFAGFVAPVQERLILGAQGFQFHVENPDEAIEFLEHIQDLGALSLIEGALIEDGIDQAHESEECGQRQRQIQIITHGLEKTLFKGKNDFRERCVFEFAALGVLCAADEFLQPLVAASGVEDVFGSDVDRFAVVGAQQPVTNLHGGVAGGHEVPDGEVCIELAGLPFMLGGPDAFAKHPDIGKGFAGYGLTDLAQIFEMREKKVHTAHMDVDGGAQIVNRHRRRGDMPGREDVSPVGFQKNPLLEFRQRRALEQREIPRVELLVGIEIDGLAQMDLLGIDFGEDPIVAACRKIEVDGAQLLVGRALFDQQPGKLDNGVDMITGLGTAVGTLDSEQVQVAQEVFQLLLRIDGMIQVRRSGFLDGAAVKIGSQDDLVDGEVFLTQKAGQQVGQQETPRFLEGERFVQRGAGYENPYFTFLDRLKINLLALQ